MIVLNLPPPIHSAARYLLHPERTVDALSGSEDNTLRREVLLTVLFGSPYTTTTLNQRDEDQMFGFGSCI